jgi:hypothetical protein
MAGDRPDFHAEERKFGEISLPYFDIKAWVATID